MSVELDDIECVLDDLRRRGSRFALEHVVPNELRGWLLGISWDRDQLWALDLPCREIELSRLRWHFELPWWRGPDRAWFQVRPVQVLADPDRYPEHRDRLGGVDLNWPLHVLRRRGRWLIVDGIHRAAKAEQRGLRTVQARELSPNDLPLIASFVVNDRVFLANTVWELRGAGLDAWIFGGWCKEFLGQGPPRLHSDVDLVVRADNFAAFDEFLACSSYVEVVEKRSSHKRAYIRQGILVEVLIASPVNGATERTVFWDAERFVWPDGTFEFSSSELPVVSKEAVMAYEAAHARLNAWSPFRQVSGPD